VGVELVQQTTTSQTFPTDAFSPYCADLTQINQTLDFSNQTSVLVDACSTANSAFVTTSAQSAYVTVSPALSSGQYLWLVPSNCISHTSICTNGNANAQDCFSMTTTISSTTYYPLNFSTGGPSFLHTIATGNYGWDYCVEGSYGAVLPAETFTWF
jgi:hypothetical protein